MGTMKARPLVLWRPHYTYVLVLIALFWSAVVVTVEHAHAVIGLIGVLICAGSLFHIGRHTSHAVASVERLNTLMFAILFSLLMFN